MKREREEDKLAEEHAAKKAKIEEKPKPEFSDEDIKKRLVELSKILGVSYTPIKQVRPNLTLKDAPHDEKANTYNFAKFCDHTILAATATKKEVQKLCDEAIQYKFASVCVNSSRVPQCKEYFTEKKENDVLIAAVVGFPLGAAETSTKVQESKFCIQHGANEIDMVINVGRIKDQDLKYVYEDIKEIKKACGDKVGLKVIFETAYLTNQEKMDACIISALAGADYVKTSTGFATTKDGKPTGATFDDVALMRRTVDLITGDKFVIGVKASGGVRTYDDTKKYVEIGANRIGTSSGVAIVQGSTTAPKGAY